MCIAIKLCIELTNCFQQEPYWNTFYKESDFFKLLVGTLVYRDSATLSQCACVFGGLRVLV